MPSEDFAFAVAVAEQIKGEPGGEAGLRPRPTGEGALSDRANSIKAEWKNAFAARAGGAARSGGRLARRDDAAGRHAGRSG